MSTPKHTPGPWVVNDNDTGMTDDGTIINLHGTVIVSSVYGQTTEIAAANAALIAAAPAMYEALQEARDYIRQLVDSKEDEAIDNLTNNGEDVEERLNQIIAQAERRQG